MLIIKLMKIRSMIIIQLIISPLINLSTPRFSMKKIITRIIKIGLEITTVQDTRSTTQSTMSILHTSLLMTLLSTTQLATTDMGILMQLLLSRRTTSMMCISPLLLSMLPTKPQPMTQSTLICLTMPSEVSSPSSMMVSGTSMDQISTSQALTTSPRSFTMAVTTVSTSTKMLTGITMSPVLTTEVLTPMKASTSCTTRTTESTLQMF